MRRAIFVATGILLAGIGCLPRQEVPQDVSSLRQQVRKKTILVPVWSREVAEELAAGASAYAGKELEIAVAHLDPRGELRHEKEFYRLPLAGGGCAIVPTAAVPPWLRGWTSAPLKLRGVLHPPRSEEAGQSFRYPLLRVHSIDFAHPLELACVQVERTHDGTWLIAHVENYRAEGARATVELRFGDVRERHRLPAVEPGGATSLRLKLFGPTAPRWAELPPEQRALRLLFDDGTAIQVDIGKWLEGPPDSLLDLGYTFSPPGNGVLMLSADKPEAELERFAALELRSYLAQFTDANLEPREPDAEEPLPAQPLLVVGTAAHNKMAAELIRQGGLEERVRNLGEEGYLLKTTRQGDRPALLVTSAAPRGIVNGVYALLERFGVQFSMMGAHLPARVAFRLPELDESRNPLFPSRILVASGPEATWAARWSQWQWLAMIDLAAKNRFNEIVFPLDGLEATFVYEPKRSRGAIFPFEVTPPYNCLAEAYLAHQRGLAILADYAQRRGLALTFARLGADGKLRRVAPPACLPQKHAPRDVGQPIEVLADPGDLLALPRVEEMASTAAALLEAKAIGFAVPYRRGAGARASFIARFAWDKSLTPESHFRRWTGSLCEGQAADKLAKALLEIDRLDGDILAATPKPFGIGAPLLFPVEEGDLACDWATLRARATSEATALEIKALRDQGQRLRDVQARLEPIYAAFREALGTLPPAWEPSLLEAAPTAQRSERISEGLVMFRALLGALAAVQEGAMAYNAGLSQPADALPQFALAATKLRKAQRILAWLQSRATDSDILPTLVAVGDRIREQVGRLNEWLGPAAEADTGTRLTLQGSDAVVHLFRTRGEDIFAAYKLSGSETVQLRLNTQDARLFRRGQPPAAVRAEGGLFILSLDAVPTYLVARRAAWPGLQGP